MLLFRMMRNPWVSVLGPLVLLVAIFTGFLMLGGDSFGHAFGFSVAIGVVFAIVSEWHALRRRRRTTVRP
jgi:hypothetical protein